MQRMSSPPDGPKYPPLLGTGGIDGRLDFSNNFMQSVVLALNLDQRRNGNAINHNQVVAALFNEGSPELVRKRSSRILQSRQRWRGQCLRGVQR